MQPSKTKNSTFSETSTKRLLIKPSTSTRENTRYFLRYKLQPLQRLLAQLKATTPPTPTLCTEQDLIFDTDITSIMSKTHHYLNLSYDDNHSFAFPFFRCGEGREPVTRKNSWITMMICHQVVVKKHARE